MWGGGGRAAVRKLAMKPFFLKPRLKEEGNSLRAACLSPSIAKKAHKLRKKKVRGMVLIKFKNVGIRTEFFRYSERICWGIGKKKREEGKCSGGPFSILVGGGGGGGEKKKRPKEVVFFMGTKI